MFEQLLFLQGEFMWKWQLAIYISALEGPFCDGKIRGRSVEVFRAFDVFKKDMGLDGRIKGVWAHWNTKIWGQVIAWNLLLFVYAIIVGINRTPLCFWRSILLEFPCTNRKRRKNSKRSAENLCCLIPMIQSSLAFDGGLVFGILFNHSPNQWHNFELQSHQQHAFIR